MVKTEQFIVGDHSYSVRQWDATKAMIMKLRLGKYLGGITTALSKSGGNIANTILANLSNILDGIDEEKFIAFIIEVACAATRDGEKMIPVRFDSYFNGNIIEAYEVAFKVIEINYKDFLESVLNLVKGKSN